jgi:hypothetical protein
MGWLLIATAVKPPIEFASLVSGRILIAPLANSSSRRKEAHSLNRKATAWRENEPPYVGCYHVKKALVAQARCALGSVESSLELDVASLPV